MGNDADGHKLLAVVASVHHKGVGEALNNGTVGLAEALDGIAAGRVRDVDGGPNLDVVTVGKDLVSQNPANPRSKATVAGAEKECPSSEDLLLPTLPSFRCYSRQ